jgi:ABC-2 type transport system ATP-binding protein
MNGFAIATRGLTKVYGPITAVDHVDLNVPSGTICGLLGPNGAGKTTIIKLLTGISDITDGEASVVGYDIRRDPMKVKERIGWVAAEVILDDDLSGWENLWLQARLQRLGSWKARAEQLLRYFDLFDRRSDRVGTYSTGMRKKLEIALALLHEPELIFMDEPTIGLDVATRQMLWRLIVGVKKEFGITVLLTTHYIEEADNLCDQVAIINKGKIVAFGTPSELKAKVRADLVELETDELLDEARLKAIPGILEARLQGRYWVLKMPNAEQSLPKLLAAIDEGKVKRLAVEKPSLETVFLELTGSRIEAAGSDVPDARKFYAQMKRARA